MTEEFREVMIICPECEQIQHANIKLGIPWNTYIHDCEKCGYCIMESEWDEVDNWIE